MSYYIVAHKGDIGVPKDSKWINIVFKPSEYFYMRTDKAAINRVIERLLEGTFNFTMKPLDKCQRWCISLPVPRWNGSDEDSREAALELAQWYKEQILAGNATINRALLFNRQPFNAERYKKPEQNEREIEIERENETKIETKIGMEVFPIDNGLFYYELQ
ncbi:uncharacterized protein N7529_010552 [Penicillium soppii]|uniref:uncharacterized protein n=1 Tax=Penicillium soppii TaxID=69789 RepID=UPI002546FD73|nr:uncharacterized protein N7529_010552 [Penicillium soppii]KAJ5856608.1 hypothetical protein N7529_010552 [Penicillium soppii]